MKTVILFLGGSQFSPSDKFSAKYLAAAENQNSLIVAADHGADLALNSGLKIDVLIGDLDSISAQGLAKLKEQKTILITFPQEKDQTDSHLALDYIVQQHYQEVVCFGLEGNRSDHFLANILLFSEYVKKGLRIQAIGQRSLYYFFSGSLSIIGEVGDLLTLLSLSPSSTGIITTGLRYALDNQSLQFGSSLGVSNVFIEKKILIQQTAGSLLAIYTPSKHTPS